MLMLGIPREHYLTLHTVFSGNNLINCKLMSNVTSDYSECEYKKPTSDTCTCFKKTLNYCTLTAQYTTNIHVVDKNTNTISHREMTSELTCTRLYIIIIIIMIIIIIIIIIIITTTTIIIIKNGKYKK